MRPGHIPALTGIRFFAAAWVVLYHFRKIIVELCPSLAVTNVIGRHGHFAVPFFFLLSGFILAHTYFPDYRLRDHGRFVFLRFAKLWPVHASTIACLVLYSIAIHAIHTRARLDDLPMSALPTELAMVRMWFSNQQLWNYPSWSIHSEWFAYLFVFPLCAVYIRPLTNIVALSAITVLALCMESAGAWLHIDSKAWTIVPLFSAGSAVYKIRSLLDWKRGWMIAPVGIVLLWVSLAFAALQSSPLIYLACATIILGLSFDGGPLNRFLGSRVMVYGGKISFSLYMTHALVQLAYHKIFSKLPLMSEIERIFALVGVFVVILMVASAFYHLVEEPSHAALRGKKV